MHPENVHWTASMYNEVVVAVGKLEETLTIGNAVLFRLKESDK